MGDEVTVGLEGPGRVVREVPRGAGQATQDHDIPLDLLLADKTDEGRRHADETAGTLLPLELVLAAGKLDGHVFGADRRRFVGVIRLEGGHEGLRGGQRIGHWGDY
jgi:hypothetical protein